MDRRRFLTGAVAGTACAPPPPRPRTTDEPPKPEKMARMKCGHQHHSSDADLHILAALGVNHICSTLPSRKFDDAWSVDGLTKLRERVEMAGIIARHGSPAATARYITRAENPDIMLGKSPERDREIDHICQMIRNARRQASRPSSTT